MNTAEQQQRQQQQPSSKRPYGGVGAKMPSSAPAPQVALYNPTSAMPTYSNAAHLLDLTSINPSILQPQSFGQDMPSTDLILTDALFPLSIDTADSPDAGGGFTTNISNNQSRSAAIPIRPRSNTTDTYESSLASSLTATPMTPTFSQSMDAWMMARSFPGANGIGMRHVLSTHAEDEEEDIEGGHYPTQHDKRRKRRESHNAVERRRRDQINERIQDLSALVPECASDMSQKTNKGVILRKSVDYMRALIEENRLLKERIRQLERLNQ